MVTDIAIQTKLQKVFEHYKTKHSLDTTCIFTDEEDCYFICDVFGLNRIDYDINFLSRHWDVDTNSRKRLPKENRTKELMFVFALLHEINHAIEYNNGDSGFTEESDISECMPHSHKPLEIRADYFATQELSQWKELFNDSI